MNENDGTMNQIINWADNFKSYNPDILKPEFRTKYRNEAIKAIKELAEQLQEEE
jgi:hypothetical protein